MGQSSVAPKVAESLAREAPYRANGADPLRAGKAVVNAICWPRDWRWLVSGYVPAKPGFGSTHSGPAKRHRLKRYPLTALACTLAMLPSGPAVAQAEGERAFVTLGTMGGPLASSTRSQPANALVLGKDVYLVDVGDGTAEQLAKANLQLRQVRAIFISHLHFDHTGGLAAVLGLRYQLGVYDKLRIYGPPGTRDLVRGLMASMEPAVQAGYGIEGEKIVPLSDTAEVFELNGGANVAVDSFSVRTAQNTHYSFPVGGEKDKRFKSLSFRFDLPGKSIVYTGDTGPSSDVEKLAADADIYVSEVIDLDATIANIHRSNPGFSGPALDGVIKHLSEHHVSPLQVGEMAKRAGVGRVVLTHIAPGTSNPEDIAKFKAAIAQNYKGEIAVANDLDRFW